MSIFPYFYFSNDISSLIFQAVVFMFLCYICCTLFSPPRSGSRWNRINAHPHVVGKGPPPPRPGPVRRRGRGCAERVPPGMDWTGTGVGGWVGARTQGAWRTLLPLRTPGPSLPPSTHHTHATACGSTACRMTNSAVYKTRWQYLKRNRRTRSLHGNHLPAITVEELERHVDYHHVSIERTMVEQARARHTLCRSVYQKS